MTPDLNIAAEKAWQMRQTGFLWRDVLTAVNIPYTTLYTEMRRRSLLPPKRLGRPCSRFTALTVEQTSIINGMLLGDGSIVMGKTCVTPQLCFKTVEVDMANHVSNVMKPLMFRVYVTPAQQSIIRGKQANCRAAYQMNSISLR